MAQRLRLSLSCCVPVGLRLLLCIESAKGGEAPVAAFMRARSEVKSVRATASLHRRTVGVRKCALPPLCVCFQRLRGGASAR